MPATHSEIIVSEPQKGLVENLFQCLFFFQFLATGSQHLDKKEEFGGNSGDQFWFITNNESRPNHPIKLVSTEIKVLRSSRQGWRFSFGMFQYYSSNETPEQELEEFPWPLIRDHLSPCS